MKQKLHRKVGVSMQQVPFHSSSNCAVSLILCCRTLVLRVAVQEETLYITPAPLSFPLHCSMCRHSVHLLHHQPKRVATAVHHPFSWSFALNSVTDGSYKHPLVVMRNKEMTGSQVRENRNAGATWEATFCIHCIHWLDLYCIRLGLIIPVLTLH